MRAFTKTRHGKTAALAVALLLAAQPAAALAEVAYLPGVTSQMNYSSYWASKRNNPNALLASVDAILARNRNAVAATGNNLIDLKNRAEMFNGISACEALAQSAESDAAYYVGWTYDVSGTPLTAESFAERIANTADPAATEEQPARYAIVTRDTCLSSFASDEPILDDPIDPDFDHNYISRLRVGEPLYVRTTSADGRWVSVYASCVTGWVPIDDIAFAENRDAWLSAWDFAPEDTLVVYGESVRTEDSRTYPATARVDLPQGTLLRLADDVEAGTLVTNRGIYGSYVVWLPTRGEDGSLVLERALIPATAAVSEGFMPLTEANIARVALRTLGKTYGWGGGLHSNDCSGYARDVFRCFGLELARNTNWQQSMDARKIDLSSLSSEQKAKVVESLPVGALLYISGHEMIYLGHEGGAQYVTSSISSIGSATTESRTERVRGYVLSTLNVLRRNGSTWLDNLESAVIPWLESDDATQEQGEDAWWHDEAGWHVLRCGVACAERWVWLNGDWYWFDETGLMQSGWMEQAGSWYYLNPVHDGHFGKMLTGWQFVGGSWYYFLPDGRMARDTVIDGSRVGSDGRWIAS